MFNKSTLYKWHPGEYKVFYDDIIITLTSRRCQYFAKMTHSLTINERKTGRDNEENKTVLKPT